MPTGLKINHAKFVHPFKLIRFRDKIKSNNVVDLHFSYRKVFRVSHQSKKIPLCTAVGWRRVRAAKEVLQVNCGWERGRGCLRSAG